jgi:thermosome
LSKGYGRLKGRAVRKMNFLVAKLLSELTKTMLGPKGMDKMLIDPQGEVVITNDGKVMMDKIKAEHPVARLLTEIAEIQDVEVGDGTKTIIVLVGALLKEAEKLLDQKIHPITIIKGYEEASKKALETLETMAFKVSSDDDETLKKIAQTVMGGRFDEGSKIYLSDLIVRAAKQILNQESGTIDVDHIDFRKKAGGRIIDTKLIRGLVLYKERPHVNMPKRIDNAKIVLIVKPLELTRKTTDWVREYKIQTPNQLTAFKKEENKYLRDIAKKVKEAGADILFCQKQVSDSMMNFFAEESILALDLTGEEDMEKLALALGAKVISDINDIKESDLGWANLAEFRKVAEDEMLFLEGCHDPKALTVLIRGGLEHVLDEVERLLKDAAKTISVAIQGDGIIAGGGATELEMARAIRKYSRTVRGKEQLAVEVFSDALEAIPEALIKNAGLDPIDFLMKLRAEHDTGKANVGINVLNETVIDMKEVGIVEACEVKKHALKLAYEAAKTILRIDDMIAATRPELIEREEKWEEKERARIQQEKVRRLLEKEEELKEIDKGLIERMRHPETM